MIKTMVRSTLLNLVLCALLRANDVAVSAVDCMSNTEFPAHDVEVYVLDAGKNPKIVELVGTLDALDEDKYAGRFEQLLSLLRRAALAHKKTDTNGKVQFDLRGGQRFLFLGYGEREWAAYYWGTRTVSLSKSRSENVTIYFGPCAHRSPARP